MAPPGFLRRRKAVRRARAHIRYLSWLPALRQPVHGVSDALRSRKRKRDARSRRRREVAVLEGRGPVLPLRHVLHDEMSVRATASLERGFSACHAASQGGEVQEGRG